MKNYLKLLCLFNIPILFSCDPSNHRQQYYDDEYDVRESPNGDKIVIMKDDNGMEIMLQYAMFTQLMNNGGRQNVIHHYHTEPKNIIYNKTTINNVKSYKKNVKLTGKIPLSRKTKNNIKTYDRTSNKSKSKEDFRSRRNVDKSIERKKLRSTPRSDKSNNPTRTKSGTSTRSRRR